MKKKIINIIKKSFSVKNRNEILNIENKNLKLNKLTNFDSLSLLKFFSLLEKKFKIKINEKNFYKLNDLNSIIKVVNKKVNY